MWTDLTEPISTPNRFTKTLNFRMGKNGYVYPFVETGAGTLMIAGLWTWFVAS